MDKFDARLFCLLRDCYFEPTSTSVRRPAQRDVAKMLQVDMKTVKSRVARWERSGFVRYYQLVPNHRLLEIRSTSFLLKVDDVLTKPKVLSRIELIDGVTSTMDFLGEGLLVWVAYQDDEELGRRAALLEEISGAKPERYLDEPFGPVGMNLTLLDWQIIKSMRNHAMKPISTVSRELKVTRKTVRAHLERLVENNAFFVRTIFDVTRAKGLIFFGLDVALEDKNKEAALRGLDAVVTCSVNCFIRMVTKSGRAFLALWAEDLEGVDQSFLSAKRIAGVKQVNLLLYKRVTEHPEYFDKLIERKVADAIRTRAKPR